MFHLPENKNAGCARFLDELESVPVEVREEAQVFARLSEPGKEHAQACVDCEQALAQFVTTRRALAPLKAEARVNAGPWFATRVMAAIAARERELEEDGVWINMRRMAPRLVALSALFLVVGSTWALQLRRADEARRAKAAQAEGLIESGSSAPEYDDALSIVGAEGRP